MKKRGILTRKLTRLLKACAKHQESPELLTSVNDYGKVFAKAVDSGTLRHLFLDQIDAHFFEDGSADMYTASYYQNGEIGTCSRYRLDIATMKIIEKEEF